MAAIIGQRVTHQPNGTPLVPKETIYPGEKMGNLGTKGIHRYLVSFSIILGIARGDV